MKLPVTGKTSTPTTIDSLSTLSTRTSMDTPETTEEEEKREEGRRNVWLRRSIVLLFSLIALLSLSFFLGFAAVFASNLSIPNPISVPSQCKIVSSGVDLRSSKVCELGLLNYKAKHVFYPSERKKFRCRYDYYWASIFKVEYKDHSGQSRLAIAEAPNEALPLHCRPTFGVAWLTKDRFKVNETCDCQYTFGLSKVNIYPDSFFNCEANDPSIVEMLRRYFILSFRMLESWFTSRRRRAWYWKWEAIAGVITGSLTSLISISLIRFLQLVLQQVKSSLPEIRAIRILPPASWAGCIRRVCLFVVYFSFIIWLTLRYVKMLGLPEIFEVR